VDWECSTDGEKRNAYRLLVGKPEGKSPLGSPRRRWLDNIKMNPVEVGWCDVDWECSTNGEKRNAYRLAGKPEGKRPLGRPRRRWLDNIARDLVEVKWGQVDWIGLTRDRNKWRALVNAVINLLSSIELVGKIFYGLVLMICLGMYVAM
jgi:hypothetical protein